MYCPEILNFVVNSNATILLSFQTTGNIIALMQSLTNIGLFDNFMIYSSMPNGFSDKLNPGVYSKDASPYDIPYGDWIGRWWQWTMSIPTAEHPRDGYSPEKCAARQNGPVWFLADQLG